MTRQSGGGIARTPSLKMARGHCSKSNLEDRYGRASPSITLKPFWTVSINTSRMDKRQEDVVLLIPPGQRHSIGFRWADDMENNEKDMLWKEKEKVLQMRDRLSCTQYSIYIIQVIFQPRFPGFDLPSQMGKAEPISQVKDNLKGLSSNR